MTGLITLTTAGADTGPFNLFSDADNFVTPFATNISRTSLMGGYTSSNIPNTTTIVRVQSIGVCSNHVDIALFVTTTTTTSTTTTTTTSPRVFYRCIIIEDCNGSGPSTIPWYESDNTYVGQTLAYVRDAENYATIHCGIIQNVNMQSIADAYFYSLNSVNCNSSLCGTANPNPPNPNDI